MFFNNFCKFNFYFTIIFLFKYFLCGLFAKTHFINSHAGIIKIEAITINNHCEKFNTDKPNNGYNTGTQATSKLMNIVITKHKLKTLLLNNILPLRLLFVLQFMLCKVCIKIIVKKTIVLACSAE